MTEFAPEEFPTGETLEIPIQFDAPAPLPSSSSSSSSSSSAQKTGRARSNSKIYGKPSPLVVDKASGNDTRKLPLASLGREQFAHIVVLSSLNETFDRKTLKVPTFPQVMKLGRPNSSQKAPGMYNGYFDSRVISREHAELYLKDNCVYLRDCNSSNGTFVNGVKISKEYELKKNDTVDLGIDIDTEKNKHQHHRKIACFVENILTVPIDGTTDLEKLLEELGSTSNGNDKSKKKKKKRRSKEGYIIIDEEDEDEMNPFDAAMFGDISRDLEDVSLGVNHDFLSGIFVNNNIGTSSSLVHSIRLLINQLHQEKMNNMKLDSVVQYLEKYKAQVERLPNQDESHEKLKEYQEANAKHKARILDLESQLNRHSRELEEHKHTKRELEKRLDTLLQTLTMEQRNNKDVLKKHEERQRELESKDETIEELKTQLKNKETVNSLHKSKIKELETLLMHKEEECSVLKSQVDLLVAQNEHGSVRGDLMMLGLMTSAVAIVGVFLLKL